MIEMEDGRTVTVNGTTGLEPRSYPAIAWGASDGYEWVGQMSELGWHVPSVWGKDGWDAGDWPYQAVAIYVTASGMAVVVTYCEGDVLIQSCENWDSGVEFIDRWTAFVWNQRENGPHDLQLNEMGLPVNSDHRGPYTGGTE